MSDMSNLSERAAAIHRAAIVVDGHADTAQRFLDEDWHFDDPLGEGMLNLESARKGNLAAEFFALWVNPEEHPPGTHAQRALKLADAVLSEVDRKPEHLSLCLSASDIDRAHAIGKFGVMLSLEGGHAIEDSLHQLELFYARGVRSMTLTWNNRNNWADSSSEPPAHHGLTGFGREVIAAMNELGMIIDVSHVSDNVFRDVLKLSKAPVVATHSCARSLTAAPRNLTDDQLRALQTNHGLCMVNFFPAFLDERWRSRWNGMEAERHVRHEQAAASFRAARKPVPYSISAGTDRAFATRLIPAAFDRLLDHFDHITQIAGIDHVGIGSDFDGIPALPEGLRSAADLPKITEALHARGYTAKDLHKLLGGNFLRVFREVEGACS